MGLASGAAAVGGSPADEPAKIPAGLADAQRCQRCLMPRATAGLVFDGGGVCGLCTGYDALRAGGGDVEARPTGLEDKIEQVRAAGRGRPYDCVVGYSGGRDSTYLLHLLVRVHKLRCLAAYYRTPFTHDVIHENVQRTVARLGVPLEPMRISQAQHVRVARRVLRMWLANPSLELTNLLCVVCKYVNRELFRIARRHGVKAVINGGNRYEGFPVGLAGDISRRGQHSHGLAAQARRSVRLLRRGLAFLLRDPRVLSLLPLGLKGALLYISPHTPYLRLRYPGILRLDYFRHVAYDEAECTRIVTTELDWRLPPDCSGYWRADCAMDDLKNVLLQHVVGATYRDSYFSNMVRFGALTRGQALRRLEQEGPPTAERLATVSKVLGIDLDLSILRPALGARQSADVVAGSSPSR